MFPICPVSAIQLIPAVESDFQDWNKRSLGSEASSHPFWPACATDMSGKEDPEMRDRHCPTSMTGHDQIMLEPPVDDEQQRCEQQAGKPVDQVIMLEQLGNWS